MSARGGKKKGAKKKAPSWQCNWCHTSKTSCKRGGPDGLQTLCDTADRSLRAVQPLPRLRRVRRRVRRVPKLSRDNHYAHDYRELELRRETHTRS